MVQECTVEIDNVLGMAAVHNLQLSHNTLSDLSIRLDVNNLGKVSAALFCCNARGGRGAWYPATYLASHDGARRKVSDLADGAAIAMSQLLEYFKVFGS